MTVRNRYHSRSMARVTQYLTNWQDQQPPPRGAVLCGEAGVRLGSEPESIVGVDVVYVPPAVADDEPADTTLIRGVPVLVVEILSPSDTQEEIHDKIDSYLAAGVPLVWVLDPHDRTVVVYRPGREPEFVTASQELTAAELPGFRVATARLFE